MRKLISSIFLALIVATASPAFTLLAGFKNTSNTAYAQTYTNVTYEAQSDIGGGSVTGFENIGSGGDKNSDKLNPDVCPGWLDIGCEIGVFLIYNVFYYFTNLGASMTAGFADITLWYSLQSWTYSNSDFIASGWAILRDLANISFIGGLLYAAFQLIMGDGGGKKTVVKVIVFALVINFSLFISRVIVDGGNILARSIYQSIEVTGVTRTFDTNEGKKEISAGIVEIASPQKIIFNPSAASIQPSDPGYLSVYLFTFFLAGVLNILMMFMFVKICLTFVGRTVGIMILMIVSPLTVFSELLPVKKFVPVKYLTLEGWFEELFQLSIMAPVYVFFLYLIILFWGKSANGAAFQVANAGTDWMSGIIMMSIPLLLTFMLFKAASDTVQKLSGELGGMIAGAAGAALGAVVGVASAAAGLAGGAIVGGVIGGAVKKAGANRSANVQKEKDEIKKLESKTDRSAEEDARLKKLKSFGASTRRDISDSIGKGGMNFGTKLSKGNYDVRDLSIGGFNVGKNGMQQLSGLGNFYGMGGIEAVDSSKKIMEDMAAKQVERINNQSALIEEAMKSRTQKERLAVQRHEASPEHEKQIEDAEHQEKELREGKATDDYDGANDDEKKAAKTAAKTAAISNIETGNLGAEHTAAQSVVNQLTQLSDIRDREAAGTVLTAAEIADRDRLTTALDGAGVNVAPTADLKAELRGRKTALKNIAEKSMLEVSKALSIEDLEKLAGDLEAESKAATGDEKKALEKKVSEVKNLKRERERKAKDLKAKIEKGDVYDKDKLAAGERDAQTQLTTINAELNNPATTAERKVALQNQKDIQERKLKQNRAGLEYIANKKAISDGDKMAKKVAKNYEREEYENLTNWGKNIKGKLVKGLVLGLVTGGVAGGLVQGANTAIMGAVKGAVLGAAAGTAVGIGQSIDRSVAAGVYAAHGRDWKLEIRSKLRSIDKKLDDKKEDKH